MKRNLLPIVFMLLITLALPAVAQQSILLNGSISGKDSHLPIPGASISVDKKGIGTSANKNGEFILIIPAAYARDSLTISCIGYQTTLLQISSLVTLNDIHISLVSNTLSLKEVSITHYEPLKIIEKAISRIPLNYIDHPHVTRGFYRMYTAKENKPLELSEAVFDIYNFGYTDKHADLFKLIKARDKKNQADFGSFVLGQKPNTIFNYDVINHLPSCGFLNAEGIKKHSFEVTGVVDVKGYPAYEISFKNMEEVSDDSFSGKFYIDTKTYAFLYFDYGLSAAAKMNGGAGIFAADILRSTDNVKFDIQTDRCRVGYQKVGDKWVLSDVTGDDLIRIDYPDAPANNFVASVKFNYQVTSVDPAPASAFSNKLGRSVNINDYESNGNEEFWKDYNILLSDFDTEDVFKQIKAANDKNKTKK